MKPHNPTNVSAVIPAYNEVNDIAGVIKEVRRYAIPIVVDDGSTDATADVAEAAGAIVVRHACNQGYDSALKTGLERAIKVGSRYVVTLDADGQHAPEMIEFFIRMLDLGADVVVGNRRRYQRFSEALFAMVGSILWDISDPLCGMKAYRLQHLDRIAFSTYQSIGTEYAIRAKKSGLVVQNVVVPTKARNGRSRFGAGWRPNLLILRALTYGVLCVRSTSVPGASGA